MTKDEFGRMHRNAFMGKHSESHASKMIKTQLNLKTNKDIVTKQE